MKSSVGLVSFFPGFVDYLGFLPHPNFVEISNAWFLSQSS